MAAKDLDSDDIKKQEVDDITTCCICSEVYTDPKALPCIHTFCMKCIQETGFKTNKGPGDEMPCPICRRLFKIPPEGFPGLPKHFFIERLIQVSKISESSSVSKPLNLCSLCLEDSKEQEGKEIPTAETYCVDCKYKLCEECCSEHKKFKATKNHKLMLINEYESCQNLKTILEPSACELHRQRVLDVFCTDCKTIVCAICFIEGHKNHEGSHVDKFVDGFRKQIESNTEAINECRSKAQTKQVELLKVKEDIQESVEKLECDVANRIDELKQLIDKHATSLLQGLCSMRQSMLKEIQIATDDVDTYISSLETYHSYSQKIMTKGSAGDICVAFSDLSVRAVELQEQCQPMIECEIQAFKFRLRKSELEQFLEESCDNLIGEIEEPKEFGADETDEQYRRILEWAMEASSHRYGFEMNTISGAEVWLVRHIRARFQKLGFGTNFVCDGCNNSVSTDYYRCLDCKDVDICKTCYNSEIIPEVEDHNAEHRLVLFRYLCKGCKGFIIATRWHCNECDDFDLCNGCHDCNNFPEGSSHNADHNVSKIPQSKEKLDSMTKKSSTQSLLAEQEEVDSMPKKISSQSLLAEQDSSKRSLSLEEKLKQEQNEKEQFMMVQRLFAEFRYKSDPVLIQTIRTNSDKKKKLWFRRAEEGKAIRGLTILDKDLFVVSEKSSEVEVHDSIKFSFSRRWKMKELNDPQDIASCKRNKCLYILDFKGFGQSSEILRVAPNGKLINKWSPEVASHWGFYKGSAEYVSHWSLSVTNESNVVFIFQFENKLNEYSSDGQLIREINLSDAGVCHPWHAIKLPNGHFLVSHGYRGDELHRVCEVDVDGNLEKSFGGKRGSTVGQMDRPVYLFVDSSGFVMVVDRYNSRVLLLDSDLEYKREILSIEKDELRRPQKILLDESTGRLFVADNEANNQRILIFNIK